MNKEQFEEKYLHKVVRITFFDNETVEGRLEKGDMYYSNYTGWEGKGYHIRNLGFMKSYIKKIKEVHYDDLQV